MKNTLPAKTKVRVNGEVGWVTRIRTDDVGEPIYTILLARADADDYYARQCELTAA